MDFKNLIADKNAILTKHFTSGRNGRAIKHVVLHYNAGDLTVNGCFSVWQSREASAHYQVQSDGLIGQLVHDRDTAWHAGNFAENLQSIGVEHANQGDSITAACLESGAHLVAAICLFYKLGRPEWGVNVFGHSDFDATACPGPLKKGTAYHDRYMKRAQEWYDAMAKGQDAPAASSGATPPQPSKTYADCRWLQKIVGATADNIWGPDTGKRVGAVQMASLYHGGKFPYGVAYTQKVIGTTADDIWGKNSKAAHDAIVKRIQQGFGITVDGILGKETDSHIHELHLKSNHTV